MLCGACGRENDRIVDSRPGMLRRCRSLPNRSRIEGHALAESGVVVRRHLCMHCGARWNSVQLRVADLAALFELVPDQRAK